MIKYIHTKETHNETGADLILPIVFEFFSPNSILDIGCGIGTWLSVAKKLGIKDLIGVDGEYVDRKLLGKYLLDKEFISYDLNQPLDLKRKFDLCLCLEVAEHLPESSSDTLVETLVRHSDTILFSAAIPGQGGQNHINEKKPEFWIEKFLDRGFQVYDPIRSEVWNNEMVDVWYKQNIFLFSKKSFDLPKPVFSYLVHPDLYKIQIEKKDQFEKELEKIRLGKASPGFYLKRFFKSLLR